MKCSICNRNKGFTLLEILVVFGIMLILTAAISTAPTSMQNKASLNTTIDLLVNDLKQQQLRAMVGDTEGRATNDHYGVYIQTSTYTLFHGSAYSGADQYNFAITVNSPVQLTTTFANSSVIFTKGTGELLNFVNGSNTLTVENTVSGEQKVITLNRYGVITSIN